MRGPELPLVLLALVLCQAPRGPAAPVPAGAATALAKMSPRGSHWAVGHLMGKKSTGESPYISEGDGLKQHLRGDIWWDEAAKNFLGFTETSGNRSHQPPQLKSLSNHQATWSREDSSNVKDMVVSLLQVLKGKEGTPS